MLSPKMQRSVRVQDNQLIHLGMICLFCIRFLPLLLSSIVETVLFNSIMLNHQFNFDFKPSRPRSIWPLNGKLKWKKVFRFIWKWLEITEPVLNLGFQRYSSEKCISIQSDCNSWLFRAILTWCQNALTFILIQNSIARES